MTRDDGVAALRADRLGRRYGRVWGLRDCTFAVPAGSVVGLVGPNGAGKTTLLSLTVGLLAPTEGEIALFGEPSRAHTAATLARVSYLAQDHPLYRGFTVADMFRLGCSMNPRWDQALAQARMDALGIPLERKIKALSGGQQAQVALRLSSAPPVTGHLGDFVVTITRSGGDLVVTYLPASRFWTLQLIQGGLFLAIAAAALGTAIWLLHKRTT